jgi:methionine sulfoxide reductase heme-binding subunit
MTGVSAPPARRDRPLILATAGVVALQALVILVQKGLGEEGIRMVLRASARLGFVLFLLVFTASSLLTLFPGKPSRELASRRRALGLSFAVAHLTAGAALVVLYARYPGTFEAITYPLQRIGGMVGFLAIFTMVATSFEPAKRWLGPRHWKRLHEVCIDFLWLNYLVSFGRRAVVNRDPFYLPFLLLLLLALGLKVWAFVRGRKEPSTGTLERPYSSAGV